MRTLSERSIEAPASDKEVVNDQAGYVEGESYKTGSQLKRERMAIYVDWLLTPESEREPRLKKDLADILSVTPATLRNYDREPFVQRELAEKARAAFKLVRLPEIIDHLSRIALGEQGRYPGKESPSAAVSAARTLLDWAERTADIREEKLNLEDLTEQELVEVALNVLQRQADDE